ncbi:hypothetical protein NEIRO03_2377 [Nematocida sp. AWRm78]|nr:hypothetical protein NEIRO02_2350 [Nematocida sp. AWRm79]KAI5186769.1 hypothetical protein NEIRO03_2377 [Nematocida sp. AWRm78]
MKNLKGVISARFAFFILSSVSLFFFFFAYDSPSPMYTGLEEIFGSGYSRYHSLLYSAYALPNLLLPLLFNLSGKPEQHTLLYTYSLIVLGQTVTTIGVGMKTFEWILAGRFIIGLGGESFTIVQSKVLASIFHTHEHGRIFGINLAIGRLGSILVYILFGSVIEQWGTFKCSLFSTVFIWIGGLLIFYIYKTWDLEWDTSTELSDDDEVHHLLPFFILMGILLACSVSIFSSNNSVILQVRLGINSSRATKMLALQELVTLASAITISIITDKYGHRLTSICLGCIFLICGHSLIFFSISVYYIPAVLLGIAAGLQACNWPCFPLLLSPNKLGIGLSLLSCFINMAYTICPPVISKLTDNQFKTSEYCTILFAGFAGLISIYIILTNTAMGYGLNGTKHYKTNKTRRLNNTA